MSKNPRVEVECATGIDALYLYRFLETHGRPFLHASCSGKTVVIIKPVGCNDVAQYYEEPQTSEAKESDPYNGHKEGV